MNKNTAISLINVNKTFSRKGSSYDTIRDAFINVFKRGSGNDVAFKAVRNLTVEIPKGETFGIVGRNGSGKSTLIHLIMGSIEADKGSTVETEGIMMRLALGMGIDPNLSARDNIYINGSILGLSFKHIGNIFHDIIDYADLNDFVDTPVKHYSKGMQARLKFSIAMHVDADIILLDEFFGGVGDEDFKKKSGKAFRSHILEGKTIIIVSHSMKTIAKYCDRAMWIEKGEMMHIGDPLEVVKMYTKSFGGKGFKNKNNKNKNKKKRRKARKRRKQKEAMLEENQTTKE